jgi:hypothetical protein
VRARISHHVRAADAKSHCSAGSKAAEKLAVLKRHGFSRAVNA